MVRTGIRNCVAGMEANGHVATEQIRRGQSLPEKNARHGQPRLLVSSAARRTLQTTLNMDAAAGVYCVCGRRRA